jgi:type IV secretory pathway VirB2 component (pilin)
MATISSNRRLNQFILSAVLVLGLLASTALAYAQTTDDVESSVATVSSSLLRILSGPVAKVVAAFLLIMAVINLLKGKYGMAIAAGFGFVILVLLPLFIGWIQGAH